MADRTSEIIFLLKRQFPGFTKAFYKRIKGILDREADSCEMSDEVVDQIWPDMGIGLQVQFLDWRDVDFEGLISPGARERVRPFLTKVCGIVRQLHEMPEADFEILYAEEQAKAQAEAEAVAETEDRKKFFYKPKAFGNLERWSGSPLWKLDEAVALSLGRNPDVVHWEVLRRLAGSPFVRSYAARRDLIERAIQAGELKEPILPVQFVRWMQRRGIECPPGLASLMKGPSSATRPDEHNDSELDDAINPKILHYLHTLLLGLAVCHYDFDPNYNPETDESDVFSRITHDLDKIGLKTGVKTTRKHLSAAAKWAREAGLKVRKPRVKKGEGI